MYMLGVPTSIIKTNLNLNLTAQSVKTLETWILIVDQIFDKQLSKSLRFKSTWSPQNCSTLIKNLHLGYIMEKSEYESLLVDFDKQGKFFAYSF